MALLEIARPAPSKPTFHTDTDAADWAVWLLCSIAALFGAWALHVGWSNGILDVHAWRQSHTAISVQEMLRGGPFWKYRTPIFGPPWQWPLEWPVYQWLVAAASRTFGTPIEQTARAVSVAAFAGALGALWVVLDVLGVARRHRPIILALIWTSPLYIFWSRTFMMESSALCFAMVYLAAVHRATRRPGKLSVVACVVATIAGALAGATKVTTFAAFLVAGAAIVVLAWRRDRWSISTAATVVTVLFAVPLVATGGWLLYTDTQKITNPLAAELVWSGERNQRFGALVDRIRLRPWLVVLANGVLGRTRHTVVGSPWVFAAAIAALVWTRRRFGQAAICGVLWAIPVAVFMQLFVVHVYYSYENGFLLAVIVGLGIAACLESGRLGRFAGVAIFAAALAATATNYLSGYFVDQNAASMAPVTVGVLTNRLTAADDVMLIYGLSYSPEVPYAAGRRAIMDDKNRSVDDPAIRQTLDALARDGGRIGSVVVCGEARGVAAVRANIAALHFPERPYYTERWCELYVRSD